MASRKKSTPANKANKAKLEEVKEAKEIVDIETMDAGDFEAQDSNKKIPANNKHIPAPGPKFPIGSIVFVAKEATADLNGFKLFPQYKKYTYTVEAYDDKKEVYSLRRLNLSLKLKEADIVAPSEKESSPLARKQY